ncbi:aspartate/glutamate racemase family protein [Mesobacterium pallidum]|uniref:aspartate/glutamate racemase family protein n=1 Tax=Mesobacterium pallidum TaxID=2872037 RepID=UPI001EE2EF29|nr:aspartate/glutamate racemase family protein [Mesobacterium pallidum]
MKPILLMNPNSNAQTTVTMCAIAATALGAPPAGWTAPNGPDLITTPEALAEAGRLVAAVTPDPGIAAVIVSAFGDPGAEALQHRLDCPVVGIGAASARAAGAGGVTFAVATTTPLLGPQIDALMRRAGGASYLGSVFATGDAQALMADADALDAALLGAIERAADSGARHVIIGGGPLGAAAERLRPRAPARLFNPILCAAVEVAALLEHHHD